MKDKLVFESRSVEKCDKMSIITETEKDDKIFNVLEFELESIKMKGNSLFLKVKGRSPIRQRRLGISKLKLDKMV